MSIHVNSNNHTEHVVIPRPTDEQDRVLPEHLTERELLIELVNYMRGFTDLMTQLSEQPMIGKMLGLPPTLFKHSHSK